MYKKEKALRTVLFFIFYWIETKSQCYKALTKMRVLIHTNLFSSYFGTLLPPGIIDAEPVTTPGLQLSLQCYSIFRVNQENKYSTPCIFNARTQAEPCSNNQTAQRSGYMTHGNLSIPLRKLAVSHRQRMEGRKVAL